MPRFNVGKIKNILIWLGFGIGVIALSLAIMLWGSILVVIMNN
jgi:voltage-gated potassium channel Kch